MSTLTVRPAFVPELEPHAAVTAAKTTAKMSNTIRDDTNAPFEISETTPVTVRRGAVPGRIA